MKIAAVQMDVVFADREENMARIADRLRETARAGAHLTVFPECSLPGYCFDNLDEARPHAETIPGPSTLRLAEKCRELSMYAVVGLLEIAGDRLFNAAALVGHAGVIGSYRK